MKKLLFLLITTFLPVLFVHQVTQAEIITDGLVSYWTFDRGNIVNKTAKDVWGNNNGKILGNPKIVPGKIGEALEFDGSGDYVNLTTLGDFGARSGKSTFEAWIKTDNKTDWMTLINTHGDECPYWGIQFNGNKRRLDNLEIIPGMIYFHISLKRDRGCTTLGYGSTFHINDGNWHHLVYVQDYSVEDGKGNRSIYINSESFSLGFSSFEVGSNFFPFTNPVNLGARNYGGRIHGYFEGMIDEVRFYDRPLTAEEVQQNFESTQPYDVEPKGKLSTVWGKIKTQ